MTSTSTDYITEQEFLDYIGSKADTGNPVIQTAISAASRAVDGYTGRIFYMVDTTMYFSPTPWDTDGYWICRTDDIATTTALVIKVDTNRDASYATTLTLNTDFILEPINQQFGAIAGWPYTYLRARRALVFPLRYYPWQPDTVQIAGTFGWPTAPPAPVVQATKIITALYFKLAEAPLGVAGFGSFGEVRVKDVPQACALLAPYKSADGFGIA